MRQCFWGITLWALASAALALDKTPESHKKEGSAGLNYHIKQENSEDQTYSSYFPNIQDIFNNPVFSNGLEAGAKAINRSVDSLMDSLFYRLLDNTFVYNYNESYRINTQLSREVFSTDQGAYVVVDRLVFGPEYRKPLLEIEKVPIVLGSHATIDILDIYLRSDAQRLAEQESLPMWRWAVNNWFGALPLLRMVLPPSFNPSHLYDPIRQVKTPFVFPFSLTAFKAMPIGTIRSYAVSGGVNLPFNISQYAFKNIQEFTSKSLMNVQTPYTLFLQGEHRINVLRKGNDLAWVGLSTSKTGGHSLGGIIGTTFFLLNHSLNPIPFKGIKTPFFPIDIAIADSIITSDQHLYEFNLADPQGLKGYLAAVRGDFSQAIALRDAKKEVPYLTFHFEKKTIAQQVETRRINNFFVYRAGRNETGKSAKITMYDAKGKYYFWEASRLQRESNFDLLLGESEVNYNNLVEMQVAPENPALDDDKVPDYSFRFVGTHPYQLVFSFQIKDLLADVFEYRKYLKTLSAVSGFSLEEFPEIPDINEERKAKLLERAFYNRPDAATYLVDDSISRVGKFHATFTATLPYTLLRRAIETPDKEKWEVFAAAYDLPEDERSFDHYDSLWSSSPHFLQKMAVYPLRLLNMQSKKRDAFLEVQEIVRSLAALRTVTGPMAIQKGFYKLLHIEYPEAFIVGMMKFAPLEKIPRTLTFFIKPHAELGPGIKTQFEHINAKKYQSEFQSTDFDRAHIAQEKLDAFFPTNLRGMKNKPQISAVFIQAIKNSLAPEDKIPHFFVEVTARGFDPLRKANVYARFETKGAVQLGKYVLIEKVFIADPKKSLMGSNVPLDTLSYELRLERPKNMLEKLLFEQQFQLSNDFKLALAVSQDGTIWSDEKIFSFNYDGSTLKVIDEEEDK